MKAASILETIGDTPHIRINRLFGDAEVWVKSERANPGASIKDRIALSMIEDAEASGKLKPGGTIIEPTSGNTGIGLALVAAVKGYRLVLTMPDTMSEERRSLLAAYGAKLELTPDTKGMHAAVRRAEELLAEHPDWYMPQQFNNPANPEAHRRTTGPEILQQLPRVDAFVAGVGTGGTITGAGSYLKERNKDLKVIAVEPLTSPVLSGGRPGPHKIQGIGAGFVPPVLQRDLLDEVIPVDDEDALETARQAASREGVLVGVSCGAALWAALQIAERPEAKGKRIVVMLPDSGERYVSTPFFAPDAE